MQLAQQISATTRPELSGRSASQPSRLVATAQVGNMRKRIKASVASSSIHSQNKNMKIGLQKVVVRAIIGRKSEFEISKVYEELKFLSQFWKIVWFLLLSLEKKKTKKVVWRQKIR